MPVILGSNPRTYERIRPEPNHYNQDGLTTIHIHHFMDSPEFQAAYQRGVKAAETDYNWQWRVHIGLWTATTASNLPGNCVQYGVNRDFLTPRSCSP